VKLIEPDINFIEKLSKDSGAPLKQCMQCGTCSVICKTFARRESFSKKRNDLGRLGIEKQTFGRP